MSSVLKKRKCSFKPTSTVKVMLTEVEALITALDYPLTLEEIINSALKKYLPPLILSLRNALTKKQDKLILNILKETEKVFKKEDSIQNLDSLNFLAENFNFQDKQQNKQDDQEEITDEEEIENIEEEDEENTVDPSIFNRFI